MDSRLLVIAFGLAGMLGFFSHPAWFIAAGAFLVLYGVRLARWVMS